MAAKIIVVGARSARQGTGPFIAAAFNRLGADVCAIVGTSNSSVQQAQEMLHLKSDIQCRGYVDLAQAVDSENPDVVAICSPYTFHAEQLELVADAGCHALVEKPFIWPASQRELDAIVATFSGKGRLLQVVNQWPNTLPYFEELHGSFATPPSDFQMRMSPLSLGPSAIPDSSPHFLGMLHALLGPGQCEDVVIKLVTGGGGHSLHELRVGCNYRHQRGLARAQLRLQTCEQRPRPAWYQIDGKRVDREVELPQYTQYLVSGKRRALLPDPMEQIVEDFLQNLVKNAVTDVEALQLGHANLLNIAAAWPQ